MLKDLLNYLKKKAARYKNMRSGILETFRKVLLKSAVFDSINQYTCEQRLAD
jgi:hypothetical protein